MKRAATGALLGLALGDATGFPAEFNDIAQIAAKCGPWRTMPLPLSSGRAYVTDDTQMTLALGEGLLEALAAGPLTAGRMEPPVADRVADGEAGSKPRPALLTACVSSKAGRRGRRAPETARAPRLAPCSSPPG